MGFSKGTAPQLLLTPAGVGRSAAQRKVKHVESSAPLALLYLLVSLFHSLPSMETGSLSLSSIFKTDGTIHCAALISQITFSMVPMQNLCSSFIFHQFLFDLDRSIH